MWQEHFDTRLTKLAKHVTHSIPEQRQTQTLSHILNSFWNFSFNLPSPLFDPVLHLYFLFPFLFQKNNTTTPPVQSSTGAGYDHSPTVYSPDGRQYQCEYAAKAVENAGTSIGIRCKDGVVLATEKIVLSKMLVKSSNRRIFTCDLHVGLACSGFAPDGRQLVNQCRDMCAQYKEQYGVIIPPNQLADRMSQYMHAHTCYHYLRPFGSSCLMAGYDEDQKKHELYAVKSDGLMFRMFGAAIGKGARGAQTEIERGKFQDKTCAQALPEIAKIISMIHDDVKDKPYVLEMSWLCDATGFKHRMVDDETVMAARNQAEAEIRAEEEEDDDDDDDSDGD